MLILLARSRYARAVSVALSLVIGALCLALAGWAAWFVVRDRAVVLRQLWGACVVEAVLGLQVVLALAQTVAGDGASDPALYWGYVVTALILLPVAGLWAFAERTRWSSVVLAVAALTVAFLELRLWQIWGAA
ncbi:hypothetical protein SAMN04489860_1535 [Paraoerskovia marina]|uniref:Integral membrane protein n=1 Tax=Paraoerskovia marina TaxID=545619 RepID=A0A1H1S5P8_9CELL|nr:hypothetical protein SAMN04489860_1535 [Paraoerskovia marina]